MQLQTGKKTKLSRNSRIKKESVDRLQKLCLRDQRTLSWMIDRAVEVALPIMERGSK
jgi:hypothetical protein